MIAVALILALVVGDSATARTPFTPPASWEREYYTLMRELHRDTTGSGFLYLRRAAQRFSAIHFALTDSIPNDGRAGWKPSVRLEGQSDWAPPRITLLRAVVVGDSIPAYLVLHEFAHIIDGKPLPNHDLHPRDVFAVVERVAGQRKIVGVRP